ncbi:MAG: hypothetical protein KGL59_04575 [Acidobacteriota bacterium]|nr:hypothetical protein [Acidobacteriota bacterium]
MSKHSPAIDWIARVLGVVVAVLGVFGFFISLFNLYFAYDWHQQAVEDRIFVRLAAERNSSSTGTLDAEVVNIGMRSIYIQEVVLEGGKRPRYFFEHDNATGANEPMTPLEPGQADDLKLFWDFSQNPVFFDQRSGFFRLANSEGKDEDAWVCIQTTRALFRRPANVSEMATLMTNDLPAKLGNQRGRRPAPPRGLTATPGYIEGSPVATHCP